MILALVKKEIRQNLFLILPGTCVVFLAFCHVLTSGGLHRCMLPLRAYDPDPMPLLSDRELAVAVAYGLLGLVLGLVSTTMETEKKTWPVLLRLPMSRGKILFGKALGGAASYLIAGVPPLVFAVVWVAIPGHYPGPFRIGMAAPAFVDLIFGLVAYCACSLIALRFKKEFAASLPALVFIAPTVLFAAGAWLLLFLPTSFLTALAVEVAAMAFFWWAAYSYFARKEF